MFKSRRIFIKKILRLSASGFVLSTGFINHALANLLEYKEKFKPDSYQATVTRLFNDAEFIFTHKIKISRLPRVAENGAFVPITIDSSLKNVEKIFILVEKNPSPLSAEFYLSAAVKPHVSARLKMAKTGNVVVIVQAEGVLYRSTQAVKVTRGGCG